MRKEPRSELEQLREDLAESERVKQEFEFRETYLRRLRKLV